MARLLVVDDDPWSAELARYLLASHGHEVVVTSGPRQAYLAATTQELFHGALIDFNMPETDGVGLAAALRNNERTSGMKLVLISATVAMEKLVALVTSGKVDMALQKPFSEAEFLQCIAVLVGT